MKLPDTFKRSNRSPLIAELDWLFESLQKLNLKQPSVLEFGCGITSYVVSEALKPRTYIAIESFKPCIEMTKKHVKGINIIDNWDKIPNNKYDLIFVDASSCPPKDYKPIGNKKFIFRDDAVIYSQKFIANEGYYVLHDWNYREGWRLPRKVLDADKNYKFVSGIKSRYGFGIYRRSLT